MGDVPSVEGDLGPGPESRSSSKPEREPGDDLVVNDRDDTGTLERDLDPPGRKRRERGCVEEPGRRAPDGCVSHEERRVDRNARAGVHDPSVGTLEPRLDPVAAVRHRRAAGIGAVPSNLLVPV